MLSTQVKTYENYINGQWVNTESGKTFQSINPANKEEVVGCFQSSTSREARDAIEAAEKAFPAWAALSTSKRASLLNKAADLLESRLNEIAEELTREEGKPYKASLGEVKRSADTLRFYAVEGQTYTGETFPSDDPKMRVYTEKEPLGVISVITPWNFPMSIPARKIAPALVTGNTVVFKPSSDTPLIGYRLAEAFHEAGIPPGVLNFITGSSSDIGEILVKHPAIKAVTFTGSTRAGEEIHRTVSMTTRTQMELGGKNPLIVMEDADLDEAVSLTINGGFSLTGQACTGTSRVIVMKQVKEAYLKKLVERTRNLAVGNGFNSDAFIGPLANEKQLKNVLNYVQIGVDEGAALLYGGEHLTSPEFEKGYYVSPAVFSNVLPDMRIAQEEIFGPVVAVIEAGSYEEAIDIANSVEYGLSASIVTRDIAKAERFIKNIEAGTVKINRTTTGNLMNAPFGGLKKSSTSTFRESGRTGIEFFTQTKTVYVGY